MNMMESVKSAFSSVFANKMRSFLTMLGIIIGISSVIVITSIGQGSQTKMMDEFNKLGVSKITISMKDRGSARSRDYLTMDDVEVIRAHPEVKNVSPMFYAGGAKVKLKNPKETRNLYIQGVNEEHRYIDQYEMIHGRFFVETDVKTKNPIVIIDNGLALKVFGREDVTGEKISVRTWRGTSKLTVVGVTKNPYAMMEALMGETSIVYMPIGAVQQMYNYDGVDQLEVSIKDPNKMDEVALELTKMLERQHRNEDVYSVQNAAKQFEPINQVLGALTAFISAVAGISLLVGGVGVMNIMLVTVTERTREIGIRKSLGATNKNIRVQFLIEAVILTAIGGVIGIILGYGGGWAIGSAIKITPKVSPGIVIGTVIISSIIGIVFGVYPANKAARLDPIEALRYE